MYIRLLAAGLSTHLGRLTVIRWYLQLDYKDLKLLMSSDTDGGPHQRRRTAGGGGAGTTDKKKPKAS